MICNCGSDLVMISGERNTIRGLRCFVAFKSMEEGTMSQDEILKHYSSSDSQDIRQHLQDVVDEYLAEKAKYEAELKFLTPGTQEYKYSYTRFRCANSAVKLNAERLKQMKDNL